ncbi:hypothetical protein AB0H70_15780, partial [Streptomyces sp. NPDC050804]
MRFGCVRAGCVRVGHARAGRGLVAEGQERGGEAIAQVADVVRAVGIRGGHGTTIGPGPGTDPFR